MSISFSKARTEILRRLESGEPLYFREEKKRVYSVIDPEVGAMNYLYFNRFVRYERESNAFIMYGYRDKHLTPYGTINEIDMESIIDKHTRYACDQAKREEVAARILKNLFSTYIASKQNTF